jgi:hypothetical protein
MRSENSVCYGCTRRTATCHATCPDGLAEAARNEERIRRRRTRMAGSYTLYDSRLVSREGKKKDRKINWNY